MAIPDAVLSEAAWAAYPEVINRMKPDNFDRYNMPLMSWLQKRKKKRTFTQGKMVQKLVTEAGGDLQFYDRKDHLEFDEFYLDAEMVWTPTKAHKGLEVVHSDLEDLGLTITPNAPRGRNFAKIMSEAEGAMLLNVFDEKIEALMDSWDVKYDEIWWRDGTSSSSAPDGIDALLPLDNTSGNIGGNSRADARFRHWVTTGSTTTSGTDNTIGRDCNAGIRMAETYSRGYTGGARIDTIFAGDDWIDGYVKHAESNGLRYQTESGSPTKVDMGIPDSGIAFNGIPITRVPTFRVLDAAGAYSGTTWAKRAYFLASKTWELAYQTGKDKVFSAPPDPSTQRLTRLSLDGRYCLMCRFPRAQFVNTIA